MPDGAALRPAGRVGRPARRADRDHGLAVPRVVHRAVRRAPRLGPAAAARPPAGLVRQGRLALRGPRRPAASTPWCPIRFVQGCINGHLSDIDWTSSSTRAAKADCRAAALARGARHERRHPRRLRRAASAAAAQVAWPRPPRRGTDVLGFCTGQRPWLGQRRVGEVRRARGQGAAEPAAAAHRQRRLLPAGAAGHLDPGRRRQPATGGRQGLRGLPLGTSSRSRTFATSGRRRR